MYTDINFNNSLSEEIRFFLCRPSRDTLCELYNIKSERIIKNLGGVNELTFEVPYYVTLDNGEKIKNKTYDKIKGDYLVRVEEVETVDYYIVTSPIESLDENGEKKLEVTCLQQHHEWKDKLVRYFEGTYPLYDPIGDNGVLNRTLLRQTNWSIGYIDSELLVRYRTFDVQEQDLLSFIFDCVSSYGTYLPIVNTVDKTLSVYKMSNYGKDEGLRVEYGQYLKSVSKEEVFEEVTTRLIIEGEGGLSINSINPSGTNYIENLNFYLGKFEKDENGNVITKSPYMSDSLASAWVDYQELLQSKQGEFTTLLQNKSNLQVERTNRQNELSVLNTEMAILQDNKDTLIGTGGDLTSINNQITSKQTQINNKQQEIDIIDDNINQIDINIVDLRTEISKENNFTSSQLVELDYFIKEKTWRDEHYNTPESLYEQGEEYLNLWSNPQLVFQVSMVDIIKALNVPIKNKRKLKLGTIITVHYPDFDIDLKSMVISIDHDIRGGNINLTIANTNDINSPFFKMQDHFKRSAATSTSVDMSKFKWNLSETNNTELQQLLNNAWDANKRAIEAGNNLNYLLNERGLTLKDPDDPMNYLRAVHNVIALTNDGGNTYKNALTSTGLVAEQIYGVILAGQHLTIQNESGTFTLDGNGVTVQDMNLTITRSDNRSRILMNATDGIKIQSSTNGTSWSDKLSADTNGNLVLRGDVEIGTGNNVFKATSQGIQLGHTNFNSAPFNVNMAGVLRARSAIINDSQFNNGAIVGSSINIGNGMFTVNTAGNVYAGNGTFRGFINAIGGHFSGNITADGTITGGTLVGSRIEGAEIEGGTIKSNTEIDVTTNLRVGNNIYVGGLLDYTEKRIYLNDLAYVSSQGNSLVMSAVANVHLNPGFFAMYNGETIATQNWVMQYVAANMPPPIIP